MDRVGRTGFVLVPVRAAHRHPVEYLPQELGFGWGMTPWRRPAVCMGDGASAVGCGDVPGVMLFLGVANPEADLNGGLRGPVGELEG
jgi:hypothetical protein